MIIHDNPLEFRVPHFQTNPYPKCLFAVLSRIIIEHDWMVVSTQWKRGTVGIIIETSPMKFWTVTSTIWLVCAFNLFEKNEPFRGRLCKERWTFNSVNNIKKWGSVIQRSQKTMHLSFICSFFQVQKPLLGTFSKISRIWQCLHVSGSVGSNVLDSLVSQFFRVINCLRFQTEAPLKTIIEP